MQCVRYLTSHVITRGLACRCISTSGTLSMPIKVGDKLPEVDLYEGNPGNKVNTKTLFGKGKSVIFAVPGAFTPTCSNDHAPGYIKNVADLKAKGVVTVACISVNDPFVMEAWGKQLGADDKVKMLADTAADFTKKIDMGLDLTAPLGGIRSKRYAMIVEDGVVKELAAEESTGLSCSAATDIMKKL